MAAAIPGGAARPASGWGCVAFFAQRDLHQAATELAFRKWHLSRGEKPKRAQRRQPEDRYRQQIAVYHTVLR